MAELPRVSVVMAVRDEAAAIEQSLGAVLAQDYPRNRLEVIVADGGSRDATPSLVDRLAADDERVRRIANPARIVAPGLNLAIGASSGEVIVRVDGHTDIAPDYVRRCVEALRASGADNVGGRMTAIGEGVVGRAVARATSSRFGVGGARFHYLDREAEVDTVYLGAWRRQTLERIGLFDEELVRNQDDELNYRLRAAGGRILLSPTIRSRYACRSSLAKLWRQYRQYGTWKVRVMQKHPPQMQPRQAVPPAFVAGLAGAAMATPWIPAAGLVLGGLGTAYLVGAIVAAVLAGRREPRPGPGELALLPVVFAILHVAYGSGFLWGLLRFAGRWGDRRGRVPRLAAAATLEETASPKETS